MNHTRKPRLWLAGLVFGAAAILFVGTMLRAFHIDGLSKGPSALALEAASSPDEGASDSAEESQEGGIEVAGSSSEPVAQGPDRGEPSGQSPAPVKSAYPGVSHEEILAAAGKDLFLPGRSRPSTRYLLPDQRPGTVPQARDSRRRREPGLRIVGTAIAGDLALAVVEPEDSLPFAVLLGEVVEGYTLAAVTEESVTLVSGDAEFTLPVVAPQVGPRADDPLAEGLFRPRDRSEDQRRILEERLRQMLQGMVRDRGGGNRGGEAVQLRRLEMTEGIRNRRGGGGDMGEGSLT